MRWWGSEVYDSSVIKDEWKENMKNERKRVLGCHIRKKRENDAIVLTRSYVWLWGDRKTTT